MSALTKNAAWVQSLLTLNNFTEVGFSPVWTCLNPYVSFKIEHKNNFRSFADS